MEPLPITLHDLHRASRSRGLPGLRILPILVLLVFSGNKGMSSLYNIYSYSLLRTSNLLRGRRNQVDFELSQGLERGSVRRCCFLGEVGLCNKGRSLVKHKRFGIRPHQSSFPQSPKPWGFVPFGKLCWLHAAQRRTCLRSK